MISCRDTDILRYTYGSLTMVCGESAHWLEWVYGNGRLYMLYVATEMSLMCYNIEISSFCLWKFVQMYRNRKFNMFVFSFNFILRHNKVTRTLTHKRNKSSAKQLFQLCLSDVFFALISSLLYTHEIVTYFRSALSITIQKVVISFWSFFL